MLVHVKERKLERLLVAFNSANMGILSVHVTGVASL